MKIDRHNYEEFFILYADNELNAEERSQVEEFVKLHPDLREELDLLSEMKFHPDPNIVYEEKEELYANMVIPGLSSQNYTEWLLLDIDNELNAEQQASLKKFLSDHPELLKEKELLSNTKLQPESILFPHKNLLYKNEKVRPIALWRLAAASVILIGTLSTGIVIYNSNKGTNDPIVAISPEKTNNSSNPGKAEELTPVDSEKLAQEVDPTPAIANNNPVLVKEIKKSAVRQPASINPKVEVVEENIIANTGNKNNLPTPEDNPNVNARLIANSNTLTELTNTQEIKNTGLVTKGNIEPSFTVSNSSTPIEVNEEPDGRKNKLRGIFRKVTRTLEKRTNIETTDDDDRLLVGGLAIKLK